MYNPVHKPVSFIHPRDERIKLVVDDEEMTIDCHIDGVLGRAAGYESVSGMIDLLLPTFDEINASRAMVAEALGFTRRAPKNMRYFGKLRSDSIGQAIDRGNLMHFAIDDFLAGKRMPKEFFAEVGVELGQFRKFIHNHPELQLLRTEMQMFDEDSMVFGCADALFIDTSTPHGDIVLYDWKRTHAAIRRTGVSYGIHPATRHLQACNHIRYSLQLAMYKYMLEKKYGLTVKECYILVCHSDYSTYNRVKARDLSREVEYVFQRRAQRRQAKILAMGKAEETEEEQRQDVAAALAPTVTSCAAAVSSRVVLDITGEPADDWEQLAESISVG